VLVCPFSFRNGFLFFLYIKSNHVILAQCLCGCQTCLFWKTQFLKMNQFRCRRPKNEEALWTILWMILAGSDPYFDRHQIFAINCTRTHGGQMFPSEKPGVSGCQVVTPT
jgi:hypothetical protein